MTAFVQNVIGNDHLMILTSRMGDPRSSFLVFFPLAYSFSTVLGTRVLLIACLSEWLNMVLKWYTIWHSFSKILSSTRTLFF